MDHEAETRTIRLTSEIIRCIAKSLLASAEELERSLWHYSTPKEPSRSSREYEDDALSPNKQVVEIQERVATLLGVARENEHGRGPDQPPSALSNQNTSIETATMKDTENYIVDFFEFSGPNGKHRFDGEISLGLSLAERQMKNERRKQGRFAKMGPSPAVIDRAWIEMARTTRRASLRKVHQGRTSY